MTTRVKPGDRREIDDVLMVSTPERVKLDSPVLLEAWEAEVIGIARAYCWKQYQIPGRRQPADIKFEKFGVHVTQDPADIETYQPAGHCDSCRQSNEKAVAYLTGTLNPDGARPPKERSITMVNIHFVEVW